MKIPTLFKIEEDTKKDFKVEVAKNSTDMSAVVEILINKYIKISREARMERYKKLKEQRDARQA